MSTFTLSDDQLIRAEALVQPALAFLATQQHPLSEALVPYCWTDGPAVDVISALAEYQNPDGGFGKRLEVDITSSASNAFAARLAMQAMISVSFEASAGLRERLGNWLTENQNEDGDWHFGPEIYEEELAPWFAEWGFPSLNPACCLTGTANLLGMAHPEMLDRVATLFAEKASLEQAASFTACCRMWSTHGA